MSSNGNPVILHIYDVPSANKYIHIFTDEFGVYHTGVEVFNKEYSFGGHPHDYSGIFVSPPKDIQSLSVSDTFEYKQSIVIGNTQKKESEITQLVEEMGSKDFKGKEYNLIRKNCNHFSNAFCKKICGKSIPQWINKMVGLIKQYPGVEQNIPKEFMTPKALAKNVKQKEQSEKNDKKKNKQPSDTTSGSDTKTGTAENSAPNTENNKESSD